jgi:hypothetical protein
MWRRASVAAFLVALSLVAPQADSEAAKTEDHKPNTVAAVRADKGSANAADHQTKGCPGTQYPRLTCDAIAAQADLEQARQSLRQASQSARQADLFRTEILISFLTMVAAIAAAVFAARAASAARRTVNAFIEVERADIAITLEKFREVQGWWAVDDGMGGGTSTKGVVTLDFQVVANNLGRSSALITGVHSGWFATKDPESPGIMVGPPKKYIVNAGKSAVLDLSFTKDLETLKTERFLLINVSYRSPLREGERLIRTCFEVYGVHSTVPYYEHRHEDLDKEALQRNAPPLPPAEPPTAEPSAEA